MWNHKKSRQARGYGREWELRRAQVLAMDNFLCRECLKSDRYTPATDVDHIKPKAKGGTDDYTNLQALCSTCHKDKTARDNSNKVEFDIDGQPIDSNHHWHDQRGTE